MSGNGGSGIGLTEGKGCESDHRDDRSCDGIMPSDLLSRGGLEDPCDVAPGVEEVRDNWAGLTVGTN